MASNKRLLLKPIKRRIDFGESFSKFLWLRSWMPLVRSQAKTKWFAAYSLAFQIKKVPKEYWSEAIYTLVYILNRSPTVAVQGKISAEIWYGRKLKKLIIFGYLRHVYVPKTFRLKFEVKSEKYTLLNYGNNWYRVLNFLKREIW